MSIKVSGIDLAQSALDAEFRIMVLERVVDVILKKSGSGILTDSELEKIRKDAFETLNKKYPDAGLQRIS
jgi:hypothetical protein